MSTMKTMAIQLFMRQYDTINTFYDKHASYKADIRDENVKLTIKETSAPSKARLLTHDNVVYPYLSFI